MDTDSSLTRDRDRDLEWPPGPGMGTIGGMVPVLVEVGPAVYELPTGRVSTDDSVTSVISDKVEVPGCPVARLTTGGRRESLRVGDGYPSPVNLDPETPDRISSSSRNLSSSFLARLSASFLANQPIPKPPSMPLARPPPRRSSCGRREGLTYDEYSESSYSPRPREWRDRKSVV